MSRKQRGLSRDVRKLRRRKQVAIEICLGHALLGSGVFRGGTVRCLPPFGPFLQATLYEKVRFCHFSARIAKFNDV